MERSEQSPSLRKKKSGYGTISRRDGSFNVSGSPTLSSSSIFSKDTNVAIISTQEALIAELQSRIAELEKEKNVILNHTNSANIGSSQEMEILRTQLETSKDERERMQMRLDNTTRIDIAIIELYLDMKDRSTESEDEEISVERREEFRKSEHEILKRENPLVVLDLLRAELQSLAAFKGEFEDELRGKIRKKRIETESQNQDMKATISDLEKEIERLEKDKNETLEQLRIISTERTKLIKERSEFLEQFDKESKRVKLETERVKRENTALQSLLTEREKVLRDKEATLTRLSEVEKNLEAQQERHRTESQKLETTYHRDLSRKQQQIDQLLSNSRYSSQASISLSKVQSQELRAEDPQFDVFKKLEKVNRALEKEQDQNQRQEIELRKAKTAAHEAEKKITQLQKKIKLLKLVKTNTKLAHSNNEETDGPNLSVEQALSRSYVEVYKRMLKEKDKELSLVNAKLTRMLMVWNRDQLNKKSEWVERTQIMSELEGLRDEIKRLQSGGVERSDSGYSEVANWIKNGGKGYSPSMDDSRDDLDDSNDEIDSDEDSISVSSTVELPRPSTAPGIESLGSMWSPKLTTYNRTPNQHSKRSQGFSPQSRTMPKKKSLSFLSSIDALSLK